ncbi:MoaD/ThiS family protein, partial [Bacillus subtilis]
VSSGDTVAIIPPVSGG